MLRDLLRLVSWALAIVGILGAVLFAVWHLWIVTSGPRNNVGLETAIKVSILAIWIPVAFLGWHLRREEPDTEFWTVVLQGAPPWLRLLVSAVWIYAVLVFIGDAVGKFGGTVIFTALGLTFYSAAAAVGVSGVKVFQSARRLTTR